jgi:putative hemolysin
MHTMIKASLFVLTSGRAFAAVADTHVSEVWTCKLNEGKKIEEVHKANSLWVKKIW